MLFRVISHAYRLPAMVLTLACLSGCGLAVPSIGEPWDLDKPAEAAPKTPTTISATTQIEWEIKKRIFCELHDAIKAVDNIPLKSGPTPSQLKVVRSSLIPNDWGALVSLSLEVDENAALSPGISFNDVMPNAIKAFGPGNTVTTPQSFNLGLGSNLSATATRIDKFDPYYSVARLRADDPNSVCLPGNDPLIGHGWTAASSSPFLLDSDLRIKDWLVGAMMIDNALPSQGVPASKGGSGAKVAKSTQALSSSDFGNDTVSIEIKFIIISSGNVTPTWKLVRVSANTASSPFFNARRTRTHDLIITLGPPSIIASNTHLASQIGNAVSNSNKAASMQ